MNYLKPCFLSFASEELTDFMFNPFTTCTKNYCPHHAAGGGHQGSVGSLACPPNGSGFVQDGGDGDECPGSLHCTNNNCAHVHV
jgi:hypothetical protein